MTEELIEERLKLIESLRKKPEPKKEEKETLRDKLLKELKKSEIALTSEELYNINEIRKAHLRSTVVEHLQEMAMSPESKVESRIFYLLPEPYRVRQVLEKVFYLQDNQLKKFRETIKPEYRDVVKECPVLKSL